MRTTARKNVKRNEYFRKPYIGAPEEDYQTFMTRVPYKAVTSQFRELGGYRESEDQQPYNDDDYQGLENTYTPTNQGFNNLDPVKVNGIPRVEETCASLWNKLFPEHPLRTGAFVASEYNMMKYREYGKYCPTEYIPSFCCKKVKISGPKTVNSESVTDYKISNPVRNCDYTWSASMGRIPGGTFYAPKVNKNTKVTISVSPFMGDDTGTICDKMDVMVYGYGCSGETISLSTRQMTASQSQTLSVVGAQLGVTYTFDIDSGGGTLSGATATSVVYTAPASNPNCANNPTINLLVGSSVCSSVSIAVTTTTDLSSEAYSTVTDNPPAFPCVITDSYVRCNPQVQSFNCVGTQLSSDYKTTTCYLPTCTNCSECANYARSYWGFGEAGTTDTRGPGQISGGCCPLALM